MEAFHVHAADPEKRAVGRLLRFALIGSVVMAVILLLLLAVASANTELFESQYPMLLWLTVGLAVGLFLLVLELLRRLVLRYRRGLFGTRLMARMALSFTLMTVIPVALIYLVSVQFVGRSIESWFAVPVERALESGLNLGRNALDSLLNDLAQKARGVASELADAPEHEWPSALNRLRDQVGVQDALIASGTGRIITTSGSRYGRLVPDLPSSSALRQARMTRQFSAVEPAESEGTGLKLRVIVAIGPAAQRTDDSRYLQLTQAVPSSMTDNAEAVEQGRRDFQQLSLSRDGLKRIFSVTLTLIFLLTVFSAVAASFLLSGWLTGPLSMLAAGTRAVAEGDYRPVKDYSGRDELGLLTQSFNVMTRQLEDARLQVERNQRELERVNARLESVLANLTAGVLVLDSDFRLTLANAGAERILGLSLIEHLDKPIAEVPRLEDVAAQVRAAFNEQAAAGAASWQRQFVLPRSASADESTQDNEQTILARGSILPERRVGYVIVFDDITGVISAQRAVAWAEVARRLAHEIKNPLTPIQLAAERMQRKLSDKLPGAEAELLAKNSQTIVNQVSALKLMVDEFRDYARLPAAQLAPLDLNALTDDVLRLYAAAGGRFAIHARLGSGLPPVMGDRTQLRQLIHNLVKNAVEATERVEHPEVEVLTESLQLPDGAGAVRVLVRDNGGGFAPAVLARAFEPYVTNKPRGTGLGLAIVKKIVDEHGARIDVSNWSDPSGKTVGAQISVLFTKLAKSEENRRLIATDT
ncbi:MAG TPA: ATP-binding protein [Burkholderiaceae bacterium]|nr:ATP-binding protein [Burkholderiaceae bacterium]HRA77368.1 ATP-binding protein [Burkholderiaceae bacterium]